MGVQVRVISIRKPHTILAQAQEQLQSITSYLLPVSLPSFLMGHLRFFLQKPFTYVGTLLKLVSSHHPSMSARLKTVLHFAEGVYAAEWIQERNVIISMLTLWIGRLRRHLLPASC
jgi:hypothetical protein